MTVGFIVPAPLDVRLRTWGGRLLIVVGGGLASWVLGWCALGSWGYIPSFDIALTYSLGFIAGALSVALYLVVAGWLLIRSGRDRRPPLVKRVR